MGKKGLGAINLKSGLATKADGGYTSTPTCAVEATQFRNVVCTFYFPPLYFFQTPKESERRGTKRVANS
jgi:hypothetical protein